MLLTVVEKLAIDVVLGIASIDEHILAIRPKQTESNCSRVDPVAIIIKMDLSAKQYLKKFTQKAYLKNHSETEANQRLTVRHLNTVHVAKKMLLECLFVTSVMLQMKDKCVLQFSPNFDIINQEYMLTKDIAEAFPIRSFFIFATNTSTKQQKIGKNKILGQLSRDISAIVNGKSP